MKSPHAVASAFVAWRNPRSWPDGGISVIGLNKLRYVERSNSGRDIRISCEGPGSDAITSLFICMTARRDRSSRRAHMRFLMLSWRDRSLYMNSTQNWPPLHLSKPYLSIWNQKVHRSCADSRTQTGTYTFPGLNPRLRATGCTALFQRARASRALTTSRWSPRTVAV